MCSCCCARLGEKAIDEGEIELPSVGSISSQLSGVTTVLRPMAAIAARRASCNRGWRRGVVQFAAEDEEGLAVDDELRGGAAFFQMRCRIWLRGQVGSSEADEEQKNRQRATRDSHIDSEDSTRRRNLRVAVQLEKTEN